MIKLKSYILLMDLSADLEQNGTIDGDHQRDYI